MNWKPAWQVHGEGDRWCTNAQVFATEAEARNSADDRFGRWTQATDFTALETDEPINYRREDNIDRHIMEDKAANDREGTAGAS